MEADWKIRQQIYHRLHIEHSDDLNQQDIELTEDVVQDAIRYFNERDIGWIYPSKSYMVALCYARWLAEHFGGQPYEYLDDPDLLYGNDPYFVQYSTDPRTYHQILGAIGGWDFNQESGMVPDVHDYFISEFML